MKITAEFHYRQEFESYVKRLADPSVLKAAKLGLNDHADEQRRQSVVRIAAYTGVPQGCIAAI